MTNKTIIKSISKFASTLGFVEVKTGDDHCIITPDGHSGVRLYVYVNENERIESYFYVRTNSFMYPAERTDLHDIVGVMLAAFLKFCDISCVLLDHPHPAVPELDHFEVYARYVVPVQSVVTLISEPAKILAKFKELLAELMVWQQLFWQAVGCPCQACRKKFKPEFDYNIYIDSHFKAQILSVMPETKNWNQMARRLPSWDYYKNFDQMIAVVSSAGLANYIRGLGGEKDGITRLKSTGGEFYFNDVNFNFIKKRVKAKTGQLLRALNDPGEAVYIPLENMVVAAGEKYVLFIEGQAGHYAFKTQKEKLKKQRDLENATLFKISQFEWADKIDPGLFEDMVKDLLEREPSALHVRKVAPLNQPDAGRDLIVEWKSAEEGAIGAEGTPPYIVKRIIVQCKAYKKNIGKADVPDIRDTIDLHSYDGYFLVVATQITTQLTDFLDKLRQKGLWVDWWNRDEIEIRLNQQRELLPKYVSIVKAID